MEHRQLLDAVLPIPLRCRGPALAKPSIAWLRRSSVLPVSLEDDPNSRMADALSSKKRSASEGKSEFEVMDVDAHCTSIFNVLGLR
jgi:hypothetical protein